MRRLLNLALITTFALAGCSDKDTTDPAAGESTASPSSSTSSAAPADWCKVVSADQLGKAIGATVATESQPFGDCGFSQEDPRATSGSVSDIELNGTNGGIAEAKAGTLAALKAYGGTVEEQDSPGIGAESFLVTLLTENGNVQVQAGARVGGLVVLAILINGSGAPASEMIADAKAVLKVAVDAL